MALIWMPKLLINDHVNKVKDLFYHVDYLCQMINAFF